MRKETEKKCLLLMLSLTMFTVTLLIPAVERASSWSVTENSCQSSLGAESNASVGIQDIVLGSNNITDWLINQAYHAPKAGVPWMKYNPNTGGTCPLVLVNASVARTDSETGVIVLAYVMFVGNTSTGHNVEFDHSWYEFIYAGETVYVPGNVSETYPDPAIYTLAVYCYVLQAAVNNTNVQPHFTQYDWFKVLRFCDVNGDDIVDTMDYEMANASMPSTPGDINWRWEADIDCNAVIDVMDLQLIRNETGVKHDVAVANVTPSKTIVGEGFNMSTSVTVENKGDYTETFNVTVYANTTAIDTKEITLPARDSTTISFTWNATGFAKGYYNISAYAWPVSGETDVADNNFTDGTVLISIPGDVNGDFICDVTDYQIIRGRIPSWRPPPIPLNPWDPNADLNNDDVIDVADYQIVKSYIGTFDP